MNYAPQQALLEANANSFATVVLAHLAAQETRAVAKFALIRHLYGLGYSRQTVLDLYGFIDWLPNHRWERTFSGVILAERALL